MKPFFILGSMFYIIVLVFYIYMDYNEKRKNPSANGYSEAILVMAILWVVLFLINTFINIDLKTVEEKSLGKNNKIVAVEDIVKKIEIKHSLLKELLEQEKFNMNNLDVLTENYLGVKPFTHTIEQSLFVAILKEKNNLKFLMSDLWAPYNYITLKNEWDTHTAGELWEYIWTEEQHNILNDKLLIFKNI